MHTVDLDPYSEIQIQQVDSFNISNKNIYLLFKLKNKTTWNITNNVPNSWTYISSTYE